MFSLEYERRRGEIRLEGRLSPGSEESEKFCEGAGLLLWGQWSTSSQTMRGVLKETNPLEKKAESVHNMGEAECCFMEEVAAERLFPFA